MNEIRVYIASPYTKGDVAINVKRQMDVADDLMDMGFIPFVPLLTHFQNMAHPRVYNYWIDYTLAWLKKCDCVLRLSGESDGADGEVEYALKNNIPVFYTKSALLEAYGNKLAIIDLIKSNEQND